jgi:hypothetical protein
LLFLAGRRSQGKNVGKGQNQRGAAQRLHEPAAIQSAKWQSNLPSVLLSPG